MNGQKEVSDIQRIVYRRAIEGKGAALAIVLRRHIAGGDKVLLIKADL